MVDIINNIKYIKSNVQNNVIYKKVNINDINSRAAAMSYYLFAFYISVFDIYDKFIKLYTDNPYK